MQKITRARANAGLLSVLIAGAVRALSSAPRKLRQFAPALAFGLALVVLSAVGAHADGATVPTLPPTDTFNSSFADVQTWSTNLIAGPGKYVIYTMLSFVGFGLVVSWIKRSVKTH